MTEPKKPKRMVDIDLFTHPKMRKVSAMGKALFVYLLLPNPSGINCLSIRQMRLGVDGEATDKALRRGLAQLIEAEIVKWDEKTETVWVVDALNQQAPGASPKIGACVRNHLLTLPASPLVDEFRERYADWLARAQVAEAPSAPVAVFNVVCNLVAGGGK